MAETGADPRSEPVTQEAELVTIVLGGRTHEVPYRQGDTVLETTRRGGLSAPFSCQAGNCATCMAMLVDGSVSMRANNALSDEEVEEGWILTCQSVPDTAVVKVDYDAL
jgi:ferredoxin